MRNVLCRTTNMAKKLKNMENETQTLVHLEYGEKHAKPFKNAKCTLQGLKCGKQNYENYGK